MVDWGIGEYEITAQELEPVAQRVIEMSGIGPGQRLLDIGTGTGNAAILAARRGAEVTGIDPAQRLIEVAQRRAADEGLAAEFLVGDATELPFEDESFDVVVSVFAVIFTDTERSFAEAIRILRPGSEALITHWKQEGTIHEMVAIPMKAVREAMGAPPKAPGRAWESKDDVRALASQHGVTVSYDEGEVAFVDSSPEAYHEKGQSHPMTVGTLPVLQRAGVAEDVRARMLEVLKAGNEDPDAFRVTSRYRIIRLRR